MPKEIGDVVDPVCILNELAEEAIANAKGWYRPDCAEWSLYKLYVDNQVRVWIYAADLINDLMDDIILCTQCRKWSMMDTTIYKMVVAP